MSRIGTLLVAVTCGGGSARGDRIDAGAVSLQQIRIVDLDGSRIAYRTPAGDLRYIGIVEADTLFIDSVGTLADFNRAERLRSTGKHGQALTQYERALRSADEFWHPLVRARLIQAADRAKRLDEVVSHMTALLEHEGTGAPIAAELFPVIATASGRRQIDSVIRRIQDRLGVVASQSARVVLELLRFTILDLAGEDRANALATELVNQPIPLPVATRAAYRIRASALMRLATAGRYNEVLERINEDLTGAPQLVLPELLMIKARVMLEAASDDAGAARAAWAAMRIVVHYPDDTLGPEALLLSADVVARLDRAPTAMGLLDECLRHDRIRPDIERRAHAQIARLKAVSGGVGGGD